MLLTFTFILLELNLLQNQNINIVKGTLSQVLNIQLHYLNGSNLHVTSLEILSFATRPCATTCNQMLHVITFHILMKFGLLFN
jgi:hypothetical protein